MEQARKIIFKGEVQGVGFRRRTEQLARGFAVKGYVCNLTDGSVELVSEGEAQEVERFLEALTQRMSSYIESQDESAHPWYGYESFNIKY